MLPWQSGVRPLAENQYAGGNDDHEAYPGGRRRGRRAVRRPQASPHAQSFPNRPIRIIVSFPPGGATDVIARTIGAPLGQRLGQNVVVDNRPGSNGNISAELAANARPDGHTLLLGSDSLFGINPHLYSRMPVDLRKAFVPVTNLVTNLLILTVNPDKVPSKTFAGIRRVRAQGQSAAVLCVDRQRQPASHRDGVAQAHRQDQSHARALQGRRTGRASRPSAARRVAMFGGGSVVPLVRSGKLRALAVSSTQALADAAGAADHRRDLSRLCGHDLAGIVRARRHAAGDRDQAAHRGAGGAARCRMSAQKLLNAGSGEPSLISVEEFTAMIAEDYVRYGKVIKDTGIKVDN